MREPFPFVPDHRISDPHYRQELLGKIEALLSVLEVAHGKVLRSLDVPGADLERLERVRSNLEGTIEVCRRARKILHSVEDSTPLPAPRRRSRRGTSMSYREYLETTSFEEYRRLRDRGPIEPEEIQAVDLERLCQDLIQDD